MMRMPQRMLRLHIMVLVMMLVMMLIMFIMFIRSFFKTPVFLDNRCPIDGIFQEMPTPDAGSRANGGMPILRGGQSICEWKYFVLQKHCLTKTLLHRGCTLTYLEKGKLSLSFSCSPNCLCPWYLVSFFCTCPSSSFSLVKDLRRYL